MGNFDEKKLPTNCIVISESEQETFYGEYYYHRLNPFCTFKKSFKFLE